MEMGRDGEAGADGRSAGVTDSPAGRLQTLFEGHRLTPTQRRIAHSMVRRAADVPFLSSVELAELAGVSQPSVTRFAVALGFDGYPALRKHLREVAPAEPAADTGSYNEYQQAVEAEIENLRASRLRARGPASRGAGGTAARRLTAAAGARTAGGRLPGLRLRLLRRQGPPGRTAAPRGRHDGSRPYRRRRTGRCDDPAVLRAAPASAGGRFIASDSATWSSCRAG